MLLPADTVDRFRTQQSLAEPGMTDRNQPEAASHLSPHLRDLKTENAFTAACGHQANRCTTDFLDYRDDFDYQGLLWAFANGWCRAVGFAALNP